MADILTLEQARAALGWPDASHAADEADLSAIYIPAVTQIVEAPGVCGRMVDRREVWRTDDVSPIVTPWTAGIIKSVQNVAGDALTFSGTVSTVTVTDGTYTAGDTVTITAGGLPTPYPVVVLAKRLVARLWNADHQGTGGARPDGAAPAADLTDDDLAIVRPYLQTGGFA